MNLSPDEISRFQQNGFLGPIRSFTGEEIENPLAPLDAILADKEPTHHRLLNVRPFTIFARHLKSSSGSSASLDPTSCCGHPTFS